MTQVRVNIKTLVDNSKIERFERDGREHIRVPSTTLPDNVIMNDGLYPADEIESSYKSLEGTFAPFGHPHIGGQYVSAKDPRAVNRFHVGAYNENVQRRDGRVRLDKIIDVEFAQRSENGRQLLDAINKGDPIHTSTGLLCNRESVNGNGYSWIARNMVYDHDAILTNEIGAATPADGVGMMVNSNGDTIDVINSTIDDENVDKVVDMIFELVDEPKRSGIRGKVKEFFSNVLNYAGSSATEPVTNDQSAKEDEMSVTKEDFDAFKTEVAALVANAQKPVADEGLTKQLEAIKGQLDTIQANAQAAEKAEHDAAVTAVVEAEILDKEVAEKMDTNALKALHDKFGKPGSAAGLNSAFNAKSGDTTYDAPEVE